MKEPTLKGQKSVHYARDNPEIAWTGGYSSRTALFRFLPRNWGHTSSREPDITKFLGWLDAHGVKASEWFHSIEETPLAWGKDSEPKKEQVVGQHWRCVLKGPKVRPSLSNALRDKIFNQITGKIWHDGQQGHFDSALHCSSLYNAVSILKNGLEAGPNTKRHMHGIYCYDLANKECWNKSPGYSVASDLGDGFGKQGMLEQKPWLQCGV
eukprot:s6889_g1.t1